MKVELTRAFIGSGKSISGAVILACAMAFSPATRAQTAITPAEQSSIEAKRAETAKELQDLTSQISLSADKVASLDKEISGLKKDQTTITAALIQAAKTEKKLSEDITSFTDRLTGLREREDGVRLVLRQRRGALAEVLAALQRMGLSPPPALLVRPDDALASVRSAVLLGAVVPEMRQQTEVLIADLKELTRIKTSISEEQAKGIVDALYPFEPMS